LNKQDKLHDNNSHVTVQEQAILDHINSAKGVGYYDGRRAAKAEFQLKQDEFEAMIATLDQENRQLRARNERLEAEIEELLNELKLIDELVTGKAQDK
jgi:hypothetical protein